MIRKSTTPPSFSDATLMFELADTAKFSSCAKECAPIVAFSKAVSLLDCSLEQHEFDDPFWERLMRSLRRYRFNVCASPLPFDHSSLNLPLDDSLFQRAPGIVKAAFPSKAILLDNVLNSRECLLAKPENPLLQELTRPDNPRSEAVVLREPRLVQPTKELFNRLSLSTVVMSCNELRRPQFFETLVIIGSPRWYPSFVFDSPRARKCDVLSIALFPEEWKWEPAFAGSETCPALAARRINVVGSSSQRQFLTDKEEEIYPRANLERIASVTLSDFTSKFGNTSEAKLLLLEQDCAVFVPARPDARVFCIEIDSGLQALVSRQLVTEVLADQFILLRSAGGGDYIAAIADNLLGASATRLRRVQTAWKQALTEVVEEYGLELVIAELLTLGASRANPLNLANWVSPDFIRTRADDDLLAILELIDWEDEPDKLLNDMNELRAAHIRAGHRVREMLVNSIEQEDISDLLRKGYQEFELEEGSGSLAAFRIIEVGTKIYSVPSNRILVPFEQDQTSWQG